MNTLRLAIRLVVMVWWLPTFGLLLGLMGWRLCRIAYLRHRLATKGRSTP